MNSKTNFSSYSSKASDQDILMKLNKHYKFDHIKNVQNIVVLVSILF